jgi:GYD domain-containing protein
VRKLIEAAGGKVISFYVTTGETDFLLISEANEAEAIIASLMAAAGAGTISDVSTGRAWTGAEFKPIMERAAKAASAYRAPGKRWLRRAGSFTASAIAPAVRDIRRDPPRLVPYRLFTSTKLAILLLHVRVAENDEEFLTFDVSDVALERAAPVVGGQATVTLVYGTAVVGNCGCPI